MIWNPKTRRIILIILAVILALTMVLSLLMPLLADELPEGVTIANTSNTEVSSGDTSSADTSSTDVAKTELQANIVDTASDSSASDAVIMDGIQAGDIDVSGLTTAQAKDKVNAAVADQTSRILTVTANGQSSTITVADLGYSWTNTDVLNNAANLGKCGNVLSRYKFKKDIEQSPYILPLNFTISDDAIKSFISGFASTSDVAAVEPTLTADDSGNLTVTAGADGTVIDQEASAAAVKNYLMNTWTGGAAEVALPTVTKAPSVSADDLSKVKDVLGTGETVYAGSTPNRSQNIVNGVKKVNGTVVNPGAQFSLIQAVAPFSEENGYATAPSYSSGTIVDTYGGGICQVSTTLYLAVLQSELQVDKRTNHSMLVGYVTPSMDAAISEEGGKDLIFTNNTSYPIYIMGSSDNGKIHFTIYGVESRDPNRTVKYESKVISETQPGDSVTLDDTVDYGTVQQVDYGHVGTTSELWKHVTVDGVTTDSLVNSDTYEASTIKYVVGTKGASSDELGALNSAESATKINIGDFTGSIANYGTKLNIVQMPEGSTASTVGDSN